MLKQSMFAALAVVAAVAVPALAQQVLPGDQPAAQTQRSEPDDQAREDGGRRWRREFRGEERGERWDRRSGDRDRMGSREGMRQDRMARMCDRGGRFSERMVDRIERATRPTAEQKAAFDQLKDAATKAAGIVKAACPAEPSLTPPGRLANAEKRLTAMLEAVRTVRPAMDAYFNSLSDEQKARLYTSRRAMGPAGERRGEWQDRGEPRDGNRGRRFGRDEDRQDDERGERGDRTTYGDDTSAPEPL